MKEKLNLKKWYKKNQLYVIGAIIGSVLGYLYWQEIGCSSGTCAITSKPLNSMLYGGLMGALFLSFFEKKKTKDVNQNEKN